MDPIELAMADPEMRALYNQASKEGFHEFSHIMLMMVGGKGNGKSSLKNSLLRLKFNPEFITEGIKITQCLTTDKDNWKIMEGKRDADLSDVVGSKEHPTISIWDFAGHEIFYSSQHVLYSPHAIYILTLNLAKPLDAPLEGSGQLKTEGDLVDYHLESIRAHTRQTGVPDHEPHVIVVGTHKDQVSQEMIESLFKNLRDHLDGKAVNELVHDRYFAIDNTKSDPEDPELSYLRAFILDIAQNQSHMGREIPISWLELKSELMKMEKQGRKYCSLQDVIDATDRSRVPEGYTPEENAVIFLKFLHLSRDILYFDTPELRNFVVLDPEWFVDVQKTIITIPEYRLDGTKSQWDRLEKEGVLEDTLVDAVWGNKKKQEDLRCDLIAYKNELLKMMEQFDLVLQCSPDSDDETGTATSYFVPSLLTATMVEAKLFPKGPKRSKPIFVEFSDKFFPIGLYHRLVIACMRRYKRKPPLAYANCARFVTDNRKQNFVITKERHYFKVELLSSVKEESDCFSHGPAVREGLDEDLRRIIDDWIPGIGYKWCFCCCCEEHKKKQEEERLTPIMDEDEVEEWFEEGKAVCDEFGPATTAIEDIGLAHWFLKPEVPVEVKLRGPKMARLYADACRQGSLPVYSTRVPVVGQYRSGKTCFIKRLMGEPVSGEEEEPITDGINIISDVQTKTYEKSQAEIDDLAGQLLRKEQETRHSAEKKHKKKTSKKETERAPEDTRKVVPVEQGRGQNFDEETPSVRQDLPTATTEEPIKVEDQEKQESEKTNSKTATTEDPTKEHYITEQEKNASGRPTEEPSNIGGRAPDHVIENAARMMEAGITEDELGTAEHPRLSFWDFGGKATYYGTHHCFITHRGVYILVMSLLQKLSDPVPDLDYKASVDNLRTGGDYLDHWLNTVRSQTLQHETRDPEGSQAAGQSGPQSSSQEKTSRGTGRPPVIIVLTHKDKVSQEYIEKYKDEIRSHVKGKAAGELVMPEIFAVDNTTEDAAVDEIRDYIRQVARGLPHMGEEVPIQWLHLNSKLKIKRKEGPFCKFREVAELARDPDINITDRHTLALVLTFLHDRGDIIFFDEPSLCDDVILQPQVLIDVFKTIITVPQYQQSRKTDPEVRKMWKRLEKEGILSDELLTRIWEGKDRELEKPFLMYPDVIKMFESWLEQEGVLSNKQHELTRIWEKRSHQLQKPFLLQNKSFLKALMEKFYLICNTTPVGDASDEAQQEEIYFVPALLSCERDNARLYPRNMYICPQALYFVFSEQFLPSGMFSRLQALCVSRFGLQKSCVFAGCARFPTDDKEQAFVISKVNHYLKVELLSSNVLKSTQGLRVRKFLSSALFQIKENWIPCIQYDLCYSTLQEDGGEPAFRPLPTDYQSLEQLQGIPSEFRAVWIPDGYQRGRTANSGGDGPEIIQPPGESISIGGMRTIGPVLDILEQGGVLTLDKCDHIRKQTTPLQRVLDMMRQGEVDRCKLGAAVEMCRPEFVDFFWREKRGKELAILHTEDCTWFVQSLQTAATESGLPCHTEAITTTDTVTKKTVELLFNTDNRMVALVISIETLDDEHWANLDYEFQVRNEKLLLPILLYTHGERHVQLKKLKERSKVLYNLTCEEIQMKGRKVSEVKLQRIIQQVMTDDKKGCKVPIVLLVNDEYGTSKGGISTINCQASQTLQGKAVVYCTVLQLKVPEQDQEAANRDDVTLIGPVQLGKKTEPTLDWLTYYHREHFPNLPKGITCIIGHADITDTAARNIKDDRYPQADLVTFTHVIPEDTEYYKGDSGDKAMDAEEKEKDMLEQVNNAKAAFSVGKRIFEHFESLYTGDKEPQDHKIFLPKPSQLFLDIKQKPRRKGELVVLSIGRVRNVEKLKGHDLVGTSMGEVVKIIKNAKWRVRGINKDDWKKSLEILEKALNSRELNPRLLRYGTQQNIRDDMMTAHLVLMPSRSEPFGLVGLEAIAAGIPVLISDKTGLAEMITDLIKEKKLSAEHRNVIVETSVNDRDRAGDVKRWTDRIVDVLQHSDYEFEKAARFKRELLESKYWEESHNAFLLACNVTDGGIEKKRSKRKKKQKEAEPSGTKKNSGARGGNIGKKSLSRKRFAHSPPPKPEKRIKVAKGPQDDGAGPSGLSTYRRTDDDMASGGSSPSSGE